MATGTTSRRWRGHSTPSSRRRHAIDVKSTPRYAVAAHPYYRLRRTRFLSKLSLQAELRAAPVPPLRVPADLVARAHADPLRDGPILGHLLGERPLRAEGLVGRLRRGAAGETTRSARGVGFSRDARACGCVCSVQPAPPGGVGRSAVWADATGGAFGVGRSAGPPRPVAARARAVNSSNNSCVCCGQAPGSCVEARRAGGRAAAAAKARS